MLSGLGSLVLARPGALWIAAAILPIVLLYFLRMRFRRKEVGSTFLWRELAVATSGGDALRRRSILLLLLQVAAVAVAAFAAAGPSLVSRSLLRPGVAFVVDVSASMGTRDCPGPRGERTASRVQAAVEAASREIDALGGDVPVMTFSCAARASELISGPTLDKARAKASLRGLAASSGSFDEGACAESISAWLSRSEGAWSARVFTDGGLDLGGDRLASAFGGSLGAVTVGTSGESVGATGLRLTRSAAGKARADFTVWNGHPAAKELRVRITRNGMPIVTTRLMAESGWSRSGIELPSGAEEGGYELDLESPEGSLAGPGKELAGAPGSTCYLSISRQRALGVLLVGRDDPFLKAALNQDGLFYSRIAAFPPDISQLAIGEAKETPDIVVAESVQVPAGLRCNLLAFGAPPPDAPLTPRGAATGELASVAAAHPLLRFVSWDGSKAGAGMGYAVKGQAVVLATSGGRPSLVAWEKDGYRSLACGIDLARSDLGLKSAFPVLVQNFVRWCAPRVDDQSAYTLLAGERARRIEHESFRFRSPGARAVREGPATLIGADEAGLYEWERRDARGYMAVNVPSIELDASPRALRSRAPAGGAAPVAGAEERERSRPLGAAAAALLAILLALEWLAWSIGSRGGSHGGSRQGSRRSSRAISGRTGAARNGGEA
jgi:hypothetical protein